MQPAKYYGEDKRRRAPMLRFRIFVGVPKYQLHEVFQLQNHMLQRLRALDGAADGGARLVVAIAGGITQIFRPGHRATERAALAAQLREEGWAFANRSGSYRDDDQAAFELLDQRICEIHRRASQIAAYDDTAAPAAQRDASKAKRTSAQRGHPVR